MPNTTPYEGSKLQKALESGDPRVKQQRERFEKVFGGTTLVSKPTFVSGGGGGGGGSSGSSSTPGLPSPTEARASDYVQEQQPTQPTQQELRNQLGIAGKGMSELQERKALSDYIQNIRKEVGTYGKGMTQVQEQKAIQDYQRALESQRQVYSAVREYQKRQQEAFYNAVNPPETPFTQYLPQPMSRVVVDKSVEMPTYFERIQTEAGKRGIYIPSGRETYRTFFRGGQGLQAYDPLTFRRFLGDVGETTVSSIPSSIGELGYILGTTGREIVPYKFNKMTEESRIIPQKSTIVSKDFEYSTPRTEERTYEPLGKDFFGDVGRLGGQVAGYGLLASGIGEGGIFLGSVGALQSPREMGFSKRAEYGLIAGLSGSSLLTRYAIKPFEKEIIVKQTTREIPGKEQISVINKPREMSITTTPEGKRLVQTFYDVTSASRSPAYGRQVEVFQSSRLRDFFGINPKKVYGGIPYTEKAGYKKALNILQPELTESQARKILRYTQPNIKETVFTGTGSSLYGIDDKVLVGLKGKSRTYPKDLGDIKSKKFTEFGEVVNIPSVKVEGKNAEFYLSTPEQTNIFYKDKAIFSKLSQAGKTTSRYKSVSRVEPVESFRKEFNLGDIKIKKDISPESAKINAQFYKEQAITRKFLESGRLGKPRGSTSKIIAMEGEPDVVIFREPSFTVRKSYKTFAPKPGEVAMTKEQAKSFLDTLRSIYGKQEQVQIGTMIPKPKEIPKIKEVKINVPKQEQIDMSLKVVPKTEAKTKKKEQLLEGKIPKLEFGSIPSLGLLGKQALDSRLILREKMTEKEKNKLASPVISKTKSEEKLNERMIQRLSPAMAQRLTERLTERQKQAEVLRFISVTSKTKPPTTPKPPKIPPPTTILPRFVKVTSKASKGRMKEKQKELGFDIALKRYGKETRLGVSLTEESALGLAGKKLKETLGASARLIPTKKPAKELGLRLTDRRSFRQFRIKKGKKVYDPLVLIQKRASRLGTIPERREIQLLR